jgi:bifunctional DNA-binding transcriptional regulator/antitoxin component of YhaV-PrlF toxin-antitoxin module
MDFDYKKYSLEKLETWVEDALNSAEASPQEIYDCIRKVVEDNYYSYKNQTSRCYELLALLNGNGKGHIPAYDEYVEKKENLVCDKEDPSPECKNSWTSFWEEYYYPEEVKDDGMRPWGHSDLEYGIVNKNKDKVKKWVLPVEVDGPSAEYFVTFPDDLLEAANLKEGDQIQWIDQGDGSYLLKKAPCASWVRGNELARVKTYQEMIDDGWEMTDDGFWIKE